MNITILDKVQCTRSIRSIVRVAGAVQAKIHIVAVSALAHIRDHRDTTVATSLLNALPKGQRVEALAYWFSHFSSDKLKLSKDKQGTWVANLAKLKDCMESDFRVEESSETSYADLTKEKTPGKTFTVEALVKMLKQKADEDGLNDDGSPKVEDAARDLAADILAHIDNARPRLKLAA